MSYENEEYTGLATTAAVVVAGTAVAGAVMQATASSGGGGGGSTYAGPNLRERIFNRTSRDILDNERSILDDSLAQGKLLEPEMYAALGLEPIYDRPEGPGYADALAKRDAAQAAQNDIMQRKADVQSSRPGKGLKGKAKEQAQRQKKNEVKKIVREMNNNTKSLEIATREAEQQGAVGRSIVGFKKLSGVADPTGSKDGAFGSALDSFDLHLSDALSGKEPLDPTLKSNFDERERKLRDRLLGQMGPDYETSTAGSQALANFDRERSEAYAQYNHQAIQDYSRLAENRAGALSDLTTGRLKNLAFPASFRADLGKNLESAANARDVQAQTMQRERGIATQAAESQQALADAQAQRDAQRQKDIGGALAGSAGTIGGAVGSTLGGASSYLRGDAATPSTSPSNLGTPATSGLLGSGGHFGNAAALAG